MLAVANTDDSGGGWRRSPIVAIVAAVLILFGLSRLACRSCRSSQEVELPPHIAKEAKGIPRYCPHCKEVVVFTREQLDEIPGDEPLVVKARKAPCPTCNRAGTTEVFSCRHCGRHLPVFADTKDKAMRRCPHCGKSPY